MIPKLFYNHELDNIDVRDLDEELLLLYLEMKLLCYIDVNLAAPPTPKTLLQRVFTFRLC